MFDIGWTEMAVVAVILVLVIGPKEIPEVLRSMGRFARKARSFAREFRSSIDDIVREVDLKDELPSLEDFKIQQDENDGGAVTGRKLLQEADSGGAAMGKPRQEAERGAKDVNDDFRSFEDIRKHLEAGEQAPQRAEARHRKSGAAARGKQSQKAAGGATGGGRDDKPGKKRRSSTRKSKTDG